jgi:hypothetical protein
MPPDQLSYTLDRDGTLVLTRSTGIEGVSPPQVVARVYDREYALLMAKSPELRAALKWLRTPLAQGAC